jgi:selenocysteine lyase/cysteine desulfurase
MPGTSPRLDLSVLRDEILGSNFLFPTPFGKRLMVYADYTASGRNVRFIERYLLGIEESYANTHTEDDETGRSTTEMLHRAERTIKAAVNGNEDTCIVAAGNGSTGAVQKLQEILGVYVPPATRERIRTQFERACEEVGAGAPDFSAFMRERSPVVFVGPYEHHSNEISWRESLAEVVEIALDPDGGIDLDDLERRLSEPRFAGRMKIGAFSAASNVTGMKSPVYNMARILHRHDALACFDFAACAPYVRVDMNRDAGSFLDAAYLSPHKYLGGPGSTGILLFHRRIYRTDLPPTFASGGTVDYVGLTGQEYATDIETREKAGTPGTLQLLRAALAMELAEAVGYEEIERIERAHIRAAMERLGSHPRIEILGNPDPDRRISIISFNVRHGDRYLHPKLGTRLLNDLFGIQSRAGCSCAGPYGHQLLHITAPASERYRERIVEGCQGVKPGWIRVGCHYTMDDLDLDYLCRAVQFLADHGPRFIPLYRFDLATGAWSHRDVPPAGPPRFGLEVAMEARREELPRISREERRTLYASYLAEAERAAAELAAAPSPVYRSLPGDLEPLSFFRVVEYS